MANKKMLIISPCFVPDNAADMHRIRISMPYFSNYGWDAEVVAVNPLYTDVINDPTLFENLPDKLTIHHVKAWKKEKTSKLGLGSLALRSLWFYFKYVNQLLKLANYDLIYFSTTQFPVLILGAYWKRKYGIKIVIDVQDPWHTNFYKARPKAERPKKYWFSYHLNRVMEPIAMKAADGFISVSNDYLSTLIARYPKVKKLPFKIIPFGMYLPDLETAVKNENKDKSILPSNGKKHIMYVGRGGQDLIPAIKLLFHALKRGLVEDQERFNLLQLHLIGTSYAASGKGKPSFCALIEEFQLQHVVQEITDRIPFYCSLNTLRAADLLFIAGPDQSAYTASKLFPYIMAQKPILAIMHPKSSAMEILKHCNHACILNHGLEPETISNLIFDQLKALFEVRKKITSNDFSAYSSYSAERYTQLQTQVFDEVCNQSL